MSKLFTLTVLFGALTFASCSGEETPSDAAEVEATVLSEADAATDAAAEITDEKAAEEFLNSLAE